MTLVELVEEGPKTQWLKSQALGRIYRLHHVRTQEPFYRIDILRRNTRVYTEEKSFENDEDAKVWAFSTFVGFLIQEHLLPCGGCHDGE